MVSTCQSISLATKLNGHPEQYRNHDESSLSPDGVDGRVCHPLEEALEEADADEEARAEVRAQRRHHRQRRRRSDPRQEDTLAAVQGRLQCRDIAGSSST